MSGNVEIFTTRISMATRENYFVSEELVNGKLCEALHDETLWGAGLFVFYHIFAFLEDAKERLNDPDFNKLFVHTILYRKRAFQEDLDHYLGKDWRSLHKSISLVFYLQHLQYLEVTSPQLLMAYVYHLYLGLLTGGQILVQKWQMFGYNNDMPDAYVVKVTDFSEIDISQLKNDFQAAMNEIADNMSDIEKNAFINQSKMVYVMNDFVVNTIGDQSWDLKSFWCKASAILMLVFLAVLAYKMT